VDRRLEHTSAWLNMFAGRIEPLSLDNGEAYEADARRREAALRQAKQEERDAE
jgi:hypothetical protein